MNLSSTRPLIYLITAGTATPDNFSQTRADILAVIEIAVDEGVDLVQIREKKLPARHLFELAQAAAEMTRETNTKLLVNDRADAALAAGADGVHLAASSVTCTVIRKSFPPDFGVGVSTHTFSEVSSAASEGADFAVFGPVFETPGKGAPVGLDVLAEACRNVRPFPVLALGGIDESNYTSVLDAGVSGFAAIRALKDTVSLRAVCRQIKK